MKMLIEPILISGIAGLCILCMPKGFKRFIEVFALLVTCYLFIGSIRIFMNAPVEGRLLYVDNLSRFIVPAIGFFGLVISLYSLRFMTTYEGLNIYYANIIWTIGLSMLSTISNNMIILVMAWGGLGLTLYILINIAGPDAAGISKKAFIIVGGSDGLMILGFCLVWLITGDLVLSKIRIAIDNPISFWAFILILSSGLAKAGAMPFHTWIPDTAKEAPIPVTAILPASLDKLLGIYLIARLVLGIFILDEFSYTILMVIGSLTIVGAVMMALVQEDFKRLLGYHAVSQVGYMVLGIGTGNPVGIAGGLFHMLNHAIYKSCLFLAGGNVEYRTKTSELDSLGGLARFMPLTFFAMLISAFSISGIPPFNGFFSKWMIYQGIVEKSKDGGVLWVFCLVSAMFGSALTLASFIKLIHAIFLGKPNESLKYPASNLEVAWSMLVPVVCLAVLCMIFGVFAYLVPLRYIIPIVSDIKFIGTWQSIRSSMFLVMGLFAGFILYLMISTRSIRESHFYIGGEELEGDMKLSGTEFYNTVKEMDILKGIYKKSEEGLFDIYEQGKNVVFGIGRFFQYLHNGVLPTYMVWTLIGMIGLFLFLMR